MPNWCENILEVNTTTAEMAKAIAEKVFRFDQKENQNVVDFNLLIPRPESLDIESGSIGDSSFRLLQLDRSQLLTDDVIHEYITQDKDRVLQLSQMSKQSNWNIGDFIEWLRCNSDEQKSYGYNLELGQQYMDNQAKYGAPTWYEWSYANWGVKWNADTLSCDELDDGDTYFHVTFNTAWNQPDEWINTLINQFPEAKIKLTYFEPGMCFGGVISSNKAETHYCQLPESSAQFFEIATEFGYSEDDFKSSEEE